MANGTDLRDFYYGTPDASSSPVAPPNKGPALYEGAKGAAGGLQNVFGNVLSSGVDLLFNTVEKAGAAAVKTLLTTFTELNRPYSMISGGLESLWDPSSGFIAGLGEGWRTSRRSDVSRSLGISNGGEANPRESGDKAQGFQLPSRCVESCGAHRGTRIIGKEVW